MQLLNKEARVISAGNSALDLAFQMGLAVEEEQKGLVYLGEDSVAMTFGGSVARPVATAHLRTPEVAPELHLGKQSTHLPLVFVQGHPDISMAESTFAVERNLDIGYSEVGTMSEESPQKLTRRDFIKKAALVGAGGVLAACGGTAPPPSTERKTKSQPQKEEKSWSGLSREGKIGFIQNALDRDSINNVPHSEIHNCKWAAIKMFVDHTSLDFEYRGQDPNLKMERVNPSQRFPVYIADLATAEAYHEVNASPLSEKPKKLEDFALFDARHDIILNRQLLEGKKVKRVTISRPTYVITSQGWRNSLEEEWKFSLEKK